MFKVPVNTPFDQYLKKLRFFILATVDSGRELTPTTQEMVTSLFPSSMGCPYPTSDRVFADDTATSSVLFPDVDRT